MGGTKEFTRTDALALVGTTFAEFDDALREMNRSVAANRPENMSQDAVKLAQKSLDFETAFITQQPGMEGIASLNGKGLVDLLVKCRTLASLYHFKVKIPEGELAIQFDLIYWFKTAMKQSALARLSMNEQELPKLRSHLIDEANKYFNGKGSDFDAVFRAKAEYDRLGGEFIDKAGIRSMVWGDYEASTKLLQECIAIQNKQQEIKKQYPLIDFIQDRSRTKKASLLKDIDDTINTIAKAQASVRSKIIDGSFPVWQMTPVVIDVLATPGLTPSQMGEIQKWIASQKQWDTIVDILSFAIPIALAIGCFFISGGTSLTLLAIRTGAQITSAAINIASGVNEFNEANMQSDMVYAQTLGDSKIVDGTKNDADRARIMGFINLVMSFADVMDAVRAAQVIGKYKALDTAAQTWLKKLGKKGVTMVETLSPEQLSAISRMKNSEVVIDSIAKNIDDKGIKNLSKIPQDRIEEALKYNPDSVDDSVRWLNRTENPVADLELQKTTLVQKEITTQPFDKSRKLKSNIRYRSGEFDYFYETDELGRITKCEAPSLQKTNRTDRLIHDAKTPGKLEGDHAGHIIADRFGGSPEIDNLVSQLQKVNLSTYKRLENDWAQALESGEKVELNIEIKYMSNSTRPREFVIKYKIDGDIYPMIVIPN